MKKLVLLIIIAVAGSAITSCGPVRSYWGIESDYGYDGDHHKHHKKHKKHKKPKHHHHHHDDDDD